MSKGRLRVPVFLARGLISYLLDLGFLKAKGKGKTWNVWQRGRKERNILGVSPSSEILQLRGPEPTSSLPPGSQCLPYRKGQTSNAFSKFFLVLLCSDSRICHFEKSVSEFLRPSHILQSQGCSGRSGQSHEARE